MSALSVREEAAADRSTVQELLSLAFPTHAEAALVEALRGRTDPQCALVAERSGEGVVGHILFTPVSIEAPGRATVAMGLAPMAVTPSCQGQGVGSALVREGLAACRDLGVDVVVVLGYPDYYPRFGFEPAWSCGLYYGKSGPNPSFLVQALTPGALDGASGEVHYHPAFAAL